jgi:hypothetical protein
VEVTKPMLMPMETPMAMAMAMASSLIQIGMDRPIPLHGIASYNSHKISFFLKEN